MNDATTDYGESSSFDNTARFPKERPFFPPDQITDVSELESGMLVELVRTQLQWTETLGIIAVGKRYRDHWAAHRNAVTYVPEDIVDDPEWMIVTKQRTDGTIILTHKALADAGVLPYNPGTSSQCWHPANYLRRATEA